jgi:4-oxalmesaconate hydratase
MIIDIHSHFTTAPAALSAYRGRQVNSQGRPTKGDPRISDDEIGTALEQGQLKLIAERGTDHLLFSPTAGAMGHHFGSELISRYWTETCNELIHRACTLFPDKLTGVCQLPQSPGVSPQNCVEELERCINEFGFVGCNLNPDPSAGMGITPSLADEWWYPLYEKLVELDVPAMVHVSTSINPALHPTGTYYITGDTAAAVQLITSRVFQDFPTLKLIIPHGGGAVPYQLARYRAQFLREGLGSLDEAIRRLYFDTAIYSREAVELLIRAVGVDNVLFASELIGAANAIDPDTGISYDHTRRYLDGIEWLTDQDRQKLFEGNARRVYSHLKVGAPE